LLYGLADAIWMLMDSGIPFFKSLMVRTFVSNALVIAVLATGLQYQKNERLHGGFF